MNITYSNDTLFCGSLEDVLIKLIPVADIRILHDHFFYEIKKRVHPPKRTTKVNMVAALIELTNNPNELNLFVKTLPKKAQQAYELLIWRESMPAEEAQQELGFKLTNTPIDHGGWGGESYTISAEFILLALLTDGGYRRYDQKGLDGYSISIPIAIRQWLQPYFPKPKGYNIEPLPAKELSKSGITIYNAAQAITNDLSQLADLLTRSTMPRTKKGDYTKVSIRKADNLTEASDWYPSEPTKSPLTLMRHEMLLDFITGFSKDIYKELTAPKVKASTFKHILHALQEDEDMLAKWLLSHLKHRHTYYEEDFDWGAIDRLFSLFENVPQDVWVSTENLKSSQFYKDIDIRFYDTGKYKFRLLTGSNQYRYDDYYDLDQTYLQPVGTDPLIDGMAFLLSAFGFVELAYNAPKNDTYQSEKTPYLTRFDGAIAIRLTDIGAYAFGLTKKLKLKQTSRTTATLRLHPEQLHVSCSDLDPITELALKEFMERLAPEFYRMTRATLLKGCQTPGDVKQRITNFRRRIPAELPKNWKDFLSDLESEESALQPERALSVFSLADRPELQRHFMQDPILRRLALRVEGHRVAIDLKDLPKVRSHLRKLGYLIQT